MPSTRHKHFPRTVPGDSPRPRLLEFLGLHCCMGAAIGIAIAGGVVLSNLGRIGDLLRETSDPVVPMVLFFASFALTFASIKMGMAVMLLPLEPAGDDEPPPGIEPEHEPGYAGAEPTEPTPVKVERDPNRLLGRRE